MTTVPASPWLQFRSWKLLLLSILCAVGMWTYADRVLIPHQISDAAAHGSPRGNFSDLYPRWIGAQELLLYGRDPYRPEVTREIQAGYYGRPLDPSRPTDPKDQQAFAYPVYVVFYLAPALHLRFGVVQRAFFWILVGVTLASILLWLRVLGWTVAPLVQAAMVALTLGSMAVLQGLKLQQLSLFVAALCAASMALLAAGRLIPAGILLALATIKPQLVLPLVLWLGIWTIGDLKHRYRWAASFLTVMFVFCAASEWFLPHWIGRFWHAAGAYLQYTQAVPILESVLPYPWGRLLEVLFAGTTAVVCWKRRKQPENTGAFQSSTCLVMALTVLTVPTFSLYNQVFLLPAILLFARDRRTIWEGNFISRAILIIVTVLLAWPWLSTAALAALSFVLPRETVERAWPLPLWTVPQMPMAVAALMLLHNYQKTFAAPARPGSS
jgi:glycosyl transferase family 87